MRNIKKLLICAIVMILLALLVCFSIYMKSVFDYKKDVEKLQFQEVDISHIKDGTYTGECNVNFIYAKVEVTVKEGAITDIKILEHKNDRGAAAEIIIDKIMDGQKIDVDAISGATNSSKVIKKAVENALTNERND